MLLTCRFVKDHLNDNQIPKGMEQLRETCENSLTAAGLHITLGHLLWNAYR